MLQIYRQSNPITTLTIGFRSLVLFVIAAFITGCSVDENIVKECGQEHPNSLWGQFLCQDKKDKEVAEFKRQLRLAREDEIRKQCGTNFIDSDFPNKAKLIYEFVRNDFDKDVKFISKKLTSELNLEAGDEYIKEISRASTFQQIIRASKYGDVPYKSIDFLFKNQCNLKSLVGVATIDYDIAGNLISMDIHTEWQSADGKIVKKELKEFTHPKYGNPAKNKRLLGENFSLISDLEKRFGKYDRSEGCFYFSPLQVLGPQELKQILSKWTPEDTIWDNEQKFCLTIGNSSVRKTEKGRELSIILTGRTISGNSWRGVPGIVSAHMFSIQSNGYVEKSQSLNALGSFGSAPDDWEPVEFSRSGPTGWVNKDSWCAQGCTDILRFLVPEINEFWLTEFKASSWGGNEDADNNFFKVQYKFIDQGTPDHKFPLMLELKGLKEGATIDKSILVKFVPRKKQYVIPKNFYPIGLN